MQRLATAPSSTPGRQASPDAEEIDADLVACAQRDPTAFAGLYRRYVGPVHAYCWRRLGSREAAEDATSQIFLKALAALPSYRGDRTFRAWLFTIAHNVVVDHYRARRPDRPLDDAALVADGAASPEDLGVAAADVATLRNLLGRLTPDQAQIIELRLVGLTEAEIARALNRRPGAVRATQYRALTRLRELLGTAPHSQGGPHV